MCGIMFKTNYYSKTLHDSFKKAVESMLIEDQMKKEFYTQEIIHLAIEDYQLEI